MNLWKNTMSKANKLDKNDPYACMPNIAPEERDYFENLDRPSSKCGYEAFLKKEANEAKGNIKKTKKK